MGRGRAGARPAARILLGLLALLGSGGWQLGGVLPPLPPEPVLHRSPDRKLIVKPAPPYRWALVSAGAVVRLRDQSTGAEVQIARQARPELTTVAAFQAAAEAVAGAERASGRAGSSAKVTLSGQPAVALVGRCQPAPAPGAPVVPGGPTAERACRIVDAWLPGEVVSLVAWPDEGESSRSIDALFGRLALRPDPTPDEGPVPVLGSRRRSTVPTPPVPQHRAGDRLPVAEPLFAQDFRLRTGLSYALRYSALDRVIGRPGTVPTELIEHVFGLDLLGLRLRVPLLAGASAEPFAPAAVGRPAPSARRGDVFLGYGYPLGRSEARFAWSVTPALFGYLASDTGPTAGLSSVHAQLSGTLSGAGFSVQPFVRYFHAAVRRDDQPVALGSSGLGYDLVVSWQLSRSGKSSFALLFELDGAAVGGARPASYLNVGGGLRAAFHDLVVAVGITGRVERTAAYLGTGFLDTAASKGVIFEVAWVPFDGKGGLVPPWRSWPYWPVVRR